MLQTTVADLIKANSDRWQIMKIHSGRLHEIDGVAERLVDRVAKVRYVYVSKDTHVPWWIIAVIHEREASQSWRRSIAQGDLWSRISIHVPKDRGPFTSWEAAACDALINCAPHASKWTDWSIGGSLGLLEQYNGEGYELYHHMASPYLWGGSDQYTCGKYVADGRFDPDALDPQLGCAPLLQRMMILDPSISFTE